MKVLVADDDALTRRLLIALLTKLGHEVDAVEDGHAALKALESPTPPAIALLDWMMSGINGPDACKHLRAHPGKSRPYVLLLSTKADKQDVIAGLDAGADDFLVKPFDPMALLARIRVAFRHTAQAAGSASNAALFRAGELVLDFERRQVTVEGAVIHLTHTQYEVLKYLAMNAGKVVTHRTLLRAVWGPQYEQNAHYLRIFIGQLRRKIEPDPSHPRYLLTDPGIGYRLQRAD